MTLFHGYPEATKNDDYDDDDGDDDDDDDVDKHNKDNAHRLQCQRVDLK